MNIHFEYSFWIGENTQKTESKSEILWENSAFLKSKIKYLFIFLEKVLTLQNFIDIIKLIIFL